MRTYLQRTERTFLQKSDSDNPKPIKKRVKRTLKDVLRRDRITALTTEEWKFVKKNVESRINKGTLKVWYDIADLNYHVANAGFYCYYECLEHHNAV